MANIRQRKGPRYTAKTDDVVLVENQSYKLLKGRLADQSKGGLGIAFEGNKPALSLNERIRVRCRAGSGTATVRYIEEETPSSFRVGIKWEK
jgi:hypothetical protein